MWVCLANSPLLLPPTPTLNPPHLLRVGFPWNVCLVRGWGWWWGNITMNSEANRRLGCQGCVKSRGGQEEG